MVENPDEMEEKSARIMFDLINKRLQHTSLYSTWLSILTIFCLPLVKHRIKFSSFIFVKILSFFSIQGPK